MQLQLSGGQGIQISGLDAGMLTQPLQIDASILQQLQTQGNVSLTLNPNVIQHMPVADPNLVQNVQVRLLTIYRFVAAISTVDHI